MAVPRDTPLQCTPDLTIRMVSAGDIRLAWGGRQLRGNGHTLRLLEAFRQPATMAQVLSRLQSSGLDTRQWIEVSASILQLHKAGVLVDAAGVAPVVGSHAARFDSFPVHIRMLTDRERTHRFQEAIRAVVKPGDVVVDIGTGTGVLAATAAQAGAARVYAIERTDMAKLARQVFELNGLADRITVIQGQSTEIELPERADVLVSEVIGNDPLEEDIIAVTNDALGRLLKPSARIIPASLRLFAQPFTAPDSFVRKSIIDASAIEDWRQQYGLDFTPLFDRCRARGHQARVIAWRTREWHALGQGVELARVEFSGQNRPTLESARTFDIDRDGVLNAVLIYFTAALAPGTELSTAPSVATTTDSWASVVWMPGTPRVVRAGQSLPFVYRYLLSGSTFTFAD